MIQVPDELIAYFGLSTLPALFLIPRLPENPIVHSALAELKEELGKSLASPGFALELLGERYKGLSSEDLEFYSLCRVIDAAVGTKRLNALVEAKATPLPYEHADLCNIQRDKTDLVDLAKFDYESLSPGLKSGNTVFQILPSIPTAKNSMYWVFSELVNNVNAKNRVSIRLDPLMIESADEYRPLLQKMLVWGKPLDWEYIRSIRNVLHSRYEPSPGWQEDVQFTDLVWSPYENETHFTCEELPKVNEVSVRGSRYLHAIFDPKEGFFTHCDGALRIYSYAEILARGNAHVRNIGKMGKRVKTFLIDGKIPIQDWTNLVCAFFVWNNDIQKYFGVGLDL